MTPVFAWVIDRMLGRNVGYGYWSMDALEVSTITGEALEKARFTEETTTDPDVRRKIVIMRRDLRRSLLGAKKRSEANIVYQQRRVEKIQAALDQIEIDADPAKRAARAAVAKQSTTDLIDEII